MRRAVLLGAAFVILTAAVQAGLLRPVDRFAIRHLQPLSGTSLAQTVAPPDPLVALRPVVHGHRSLLVSAGAVAFAPADTLAALVIVAAAGLVLYRRGRPREAAAWAVALLLGLAIEGLGKGLVDQIRYAPGSTVLGVTLNGSYPSGHTIRSVILATMAATLWPRARPLLIAWVALVTSLLELGGLHVPSDIAGGFLAAGALASAAIAYGHPGKRAAGGRGPLQSGGHAARQASEQANVQGPAGAANGGRR
jgi:membrane-associated phospholipid phosphatase